MPTDIFKFWAQMKPHERTHPADRDVFSRVGDFGHAFDLRCLPGNIAGPLRTARVVLLFLSPGFSELDVRRARSKAWQQHAADKRTGRAPFRDDGAGYSWLMSRTKVFGLDDETVRTKFSVMNIGAYHSKDFHDWHLLAALPSSRVSLDWAQGVLFPQAIRGERVVICMRAASFWGLCQGERYGKGLFAPFVNRGGFMRKSTPAEAKMRDQIISAVQRAVDRRGPSRRIVPN
ncbi:MAG: hypothetical protein AB7O60_03695 [Variibacter sp.]